MFNFYGFYTLFMDSVSVSAELKERAAGASARTEKYFDKSGDGVNGSAAGRGSTRAPAMDGATGKLGWVWEFGVPW